MTTLEGLMLKQLACVLAWRGTEQVQYTQVEELFALGEKHLLAVFTMKMLFMRAKAVNVNISQIEDKIWLIKICVLTGDL